jgi:antitoxin component YwqK of YwqJK toxin-antitoxin module
MVKARVLVIGMVGCGLIGAATRASEQAAQADKPSATHAKAKAEPEQPKVDAKADPPSSVGSSDALEVQETKWPNGNPQSRIEGKKDEDGEFVRHGVSTVWYENGQKKSEQHFVNDVPNGPRLTWYIDGRKWTEGQYVDGLEDGVWRAWLADGTPQTEWTMRRGVWHGMYTEWHPNGKKRMQVEFVQGKRQGPMTTWDDQGVVVLTTDFVDGVEQP